MLAHRRVPFSTNTLPENPSVVLELPAKVFAALPDICVNAGKDFMFFTIMAKRNKMKFKALHI